MGKALKFTQKPPQTAPPAPPVAPPAPPVAAPPAPPAAAPPADPAAGKKGKAKKAPAPVDPIAVASSAATAATEAAIRTIQGSTPKPANPVDALSDDDKRDYEVAQHLARLDSRYADAPKIILDHINRAEDYATRWETANPGKEFNASDEEHDVFFATLQRPWSANDFSEARIDLAAEKKMERYRQEHEGSLQTVQQDQAHIELAPVVDRKFNDATVLLSKAVGDDVHKLLTTGGWDELHKADPVTAQVLAATLDQLHPFIEAAIEIDDPRQRVRINTKNEAHANWNRVVSVGEAGLVGQPDDGGRMFARRADYVRMTPAQQAAHWYLTTDMIIQGALDYAAEQVKNVANTQNERLKSMGFTRTPAAPGATPPTPPPNPAPPNPPAPSVDKPISPTVGSGAKIDDTGGAPKSGEAALMQQISGILFRK